jgi:nickel-dependent lactate racemase
VRFVERYAIVPVGRRFRTVVTSAAGYPLDRTYYQTVKGMVAPLDILAPGGDLVVVSECAEGMGSSAYVAAQERLVRLGAGGFWDDIREKPRADVDEWQTQMQLKPLRAGRVHLYAPLLSDADRALTGVEMVASPERAVLESVRASGDPHVAVIPEGPYVVPVYRAQA